MYIYISEIVPIIFCYYIVIRYWKFRGKSFDELTNDEIVLLNKCQSRDIFWRRNKTVKQYLPVLQKRILRNLIYAILLTIIFIVSLVFNIPELIL